MFAQGHVFAYGRILRQCYNDALREVGAIGRRCDYHCVGQGCLSTPFDVGIGGHIAHFGSHSTHYIAACPACGCFTGLYLGNGLCNIVRIVFRAGGKGRFTYVLDVVVVDECQLPVGSVIG